MSNLNQIISKTSYFYKKEDLPNIKVGDTVKVTIYLELPKKSDPENSKKEKVVLKHAVP